MIDKRSNGLYAELDRRIIKRTIFLPSSRDKGIFRKSPTRASSSPNVANSSNSFSNPISRSTVILAFHLGEFLHSNHAYTILIDDSTRDLISDIVKKTFRPSSISRGISVREDRARARSYSTEASSWPSDWAVDRSSMREVLKTFEEDIEALRQLQDLCWNTFQHRVSLAYSASTLLGAWRFDTSHSFIPDYVEDPERIFVSLNDCNNNIVWEYL